MIILDTNIISEMMKASPNVNVTDWLDQQDASELFITTVTIAEISYGLNALPKGNRRNTLENAFAHAVNEAFKHSVLGFDEVAAHHYGRIMAHRKKLGRPLSICDGQISAIAYTQRYSIGTRNINDFLDCDIELINPFEKST